MPDALAWVPFLTAQVGATAALSGLVIVAISINLTRILSFPTLPGRAGEVLIVLGGALSLSSVLMMPGDAGVLGTVSTLVAAAVWTATVVIESRAFGKLGSEAPRSSFTLRVLSVQSAALAMLIGSALLMANAGSGFYWIAAGVLLAVINAIVATWVLLVEIVR